MTLRRATILAHGLLALVLVAGAGWWVWISLAYTPDPDEDWPVGPGFIAIPIAVVLLVGAGAVALAVWRWIRSSNRMSLVIGDLMAALTVAPVGVLMPAPLALGALGALAVAGAVVAANKPAMEGSDRPPSMGIRHSPAAIFVVVVAAVVVGAVFVAPLLMSLVTFGNAD
jgi:hypothetical protein